MAHPKHYLAHRLSPLALALQLVLAATALHAQAQVPGASPASQARPYNIPAGPLSPALNRFAQAAGVALSIDESRVAGLRTTGLDGEYSVEEGFRRLLQGTGFSAQKTDVGYILTPSASRAPSERRSALTPGESEDVASDAAAEQALGNVVVSASRSNVEADKAPQTVQIISKRDIEQQLSISTNSSDALSNLIPSYTPSRGKMNGSGETLRGRTPLILVDGVPQSNPTRPTGREAHTIDFSMVDRIEVIQGASAINGLGATGGTINIVTKSPAKGSFNQHLDVQATVPTSNLGDDALSYKTSYQVDGRKDKLEYLFSLAYEDQGLYRDAQDRRIGADNTQGDLMDSRSYDVLAKLGYWIDDDQRLQFSVNRYQIKNKMNYLAVAGNRTQGIPTTSVRGEPPGSPPWNDVWTTSISYNNYNLAGMELSAVLFNQEFEGLFGADNSSTFQDTTIAPNGTLYDQSRAVSSKLGSKVTLTKSDLFDSRLKLTGGFDTLFDKGKQDLYGTGRTYVPESEYKNISLFLQSEYRLHDKVTLHAGMRKEFADLSIDSYRTLARYNRVFVQGGKLNFDETLYNAGLVFTPSKDWTLFTSYSEGFGMPDVGRVLRSINTAGQSVDQMKSLGPILTKSVELGARFKRGPWDADASYFESRSDYGTRVVAVGTMFALSREKNEIRGVDASLGYRFNAAHQAKLGYSHTSGRYDSNADGRLDAKLDGLNVAPDRLIASWNAKWTDQWSSFIQAQHAFSKNFDVAAQNFKGYTLVDLNVQRKLSKGTVRVAVGNLFNEDYITYYSQSALIEPLRYFAGRGRTLTVGYALNF